VAAGPDRAPLSDGTEIKVLTGVDDHSRYCVSAAVMTRATGRAVCRALVAALRGYGVPEEVLTDNGKQFTGRFGSGFKSRPKSDAGIRQVPLAPLVVEAIRRQLPPGSDPEDLVFTGPGGGGPGVPRGTRTVLSRHNLHRTYHNALANPTTPLRPTARRILLILRDGGRQRLDQLAARLTATGRRPIRPATVAAAWASCTPPAWPPSMTTTRTS
jgi:hypothetical protein